jgi:hypothetical protein
MKLKGRYIKALKNFKPGFTKDNYYEITEEDTSVPYVRNNENRDSAVAMDRIKKGDIELMPENFDPNNIVTELEIEIW